jgi:hypothetical protein
MDLLPGEELSALRTLGVNKDYRQAQLFGAALSLCWIE